MSNGRLTLHSNIYASGVETHKDLLDERPCVLSRERAKKVGSMVQESMPEKGGFKKCRLCHPELLVGNPVVRSLMDNRIATFMNAAPFWPHDHRLIYMKHSDPEIMKNTFHIIHMNQIRKIDFHYMLLGAIELGKKFAKKPLTTTDLPRMMFGLNIGPKAGQSLTHIHSQYGWEIVLDKKDIPRTALYLYFEELAKEDLIIHESKSASYSLIAPWTPPGQFAVDLYFHDKHEIRDLTENEAKIFAHFATNILELYDDYKICNMNIIFDGSPLGRAIVPLRIRFVPRVNMTALYEIYGKDVVDTPPTAIAEFFRGRKNWQMIEEQLPNFDPKKEYDKIIKKGEKD